MNGELTPDERAALRARIIGGAHDIRPVGAHRNAWVAGSVAAVLVVAIAGGVAVTSTLSAPPVTTTPSPTATVSAAPTPSRTPTPTPTPTPTAKPTPPAARAAFDGECASMMTAEEVSAVIGVAMDPSAGLDIYDPGLLGGISCQWRETGDGSESVGIDVFPVSVVPAAISESVGVPSDCSIYGSRCWASERFGDSVVFVRAGTDDVIARLLAAAGERAVDQEARPQGLPEGAWVVPECDSVLQWAQDARGRGDLVPHQGDYVPWGLAWEVMSANGAAAYCAIDNTSAPLDVPTVVDLWFGPGSPLDVAGVDRKGGQPISVAGVEEAWFFPDFTPISQALLVRSGPNTLQISTRSLDQTEMAQIASGLVGRLG